MALTRNAIRLALRGASAQPVRSAPIRTRTFTTTAMRSLEKDSKQSPLTGDPKMQPESDKSDLPNMRVSIQDATRANPTLIPIWREGFGGPELDRG